MILLIFFSRFICMTELARRYEFDAQLYITRLLFLREEPIPMEHNLFLLV